MGRQHDKRRHSESGTPQRGLQQQAEELTALLADARSYVASEDELPDETSAATGTCTGELPQPTQGDRHTPPAANGRSPGPCVRCSLRSCAQRLHTLTSTGTCERRLLSHRRGASGDRPDVAGRKHAAHRVATDGEGPCPRPARYHTLPPAGVVPEGARHARMHANACTACRQRRIDRRILTCTTCPYACRRAMSTLSPRNERPTAAGGASGAHAGRSWPSVATRYGALQPCVPGCSRTYSEAATVCTQAAATCTPGCNRICPRC